MINAPKRRTVRRIAASALILGAVMSVSMSTASAGIQGSGHAAHSNGIQGTGGSRLTPDGIEGTG